MSWRARRALPLLAPAWIVIAGLSPLFLGVLPGRMAYAQEGAATTETGSQPQDALRVYFYSPRRGQTAAGVTEVWFDVSGEVTPDLVILRVDGRERARFTEPPFRRTVDLGEVNEEHTFEVIGRLGGEELGRGSMTTPSLHVDEVLDLELRQLYLTVEGREGRIADLERHEIAVFDDGVRQEIATFEGGDAPIVAALLVDASLSMTGDPLRAAVAGAREFTSGLRSYDEASVVLFSDRTLSRTDFVAAAETRLAELETVRAEGGTALNDQLYVALKALDQRLGRRVIILLSDGVDVHSSLDIEHALWMMQRSQSVVFWIELRSEEGVGVISPWRSREQHDDELSTLRRLVEESGGRTIPIASAAEAPEVFAEILAELREQYVVGYYPSRDLDDGAWHPVTVRLERRDAKLRTRNGYWDLP